MRFPTDLARISRRLAAASLLALAVVPPAAAGSDERADTAQRLHASASVSSAPVLAVRNVTATSQQAAPSPRPASNRDRRLNDDLARFSRAF